MSLVVIIGLTVAVGSLLWLSAEQSRRINKYEQTLVKKSKRTKK